MSEVEAGQTAVETPTDDYVLHSEEVAKETAKAPEVTEDEKQSDDESETAEAPKKKGGFQKKIERLKTEYDAVSKRAAKAEAELERLRSGVQQPKEPAKTDGRPKPEDFEQYHDYLKADALYDIREERKAEKAQEERVTNEAKAMQTYQAKVDALTERAEAFRETAPDFDDAIEAVEKAGLTPPHIVMAVLNSDIGEQVGYYLAKNPAELMAMQNMNEVQLAKAIGKIEAKLESQGTEPAVRTTKAPPPISPIKNTAKSTKSLDELPYEEYKREMDKRDREKRR